MADTEARWYCVNAQGLPMLCASKEDAEREAARNDKVWPKGAPHRAVQLCDAAERDRLRADVRELVERAGRLVEHADFKLGGVLSADSKAAEIPSNAVSMVKARHLASLRDLLAKHKETT